MVENSDVIVVLTTGKQDRGTRATLAFGWACTALAMSKNVKLYLTMDGTTWAMQGSADTVKVEGFEPLNEYIEQFFDLGGEMFVCAPCSEYYCTFAKTGNDKLLPQARLAGLSTIVGMISGNTNVVTF